MGDRVAASQSFFLIGRDEYYMCLKSRELALRSEAIRGCDWLGGLVGADGS